MVVGRSTNQDKMPIERILSTLGDETLSATELILLGNWASWKYFRFGAIVSTRN